MAFIFWMRALRDSPMALVDGVAPGCRESGGKAHRVGTRKGNPYLCSTLVECAGAAVKKKDCHLGRNYRHLAAQTGSKKKARRRSASFMNH